MDFLQLEEIRQQALELLKQDTPPLHPYDCTKCGLRRPIVQDYRAFIRAIGDWRHIVKYGECTFCT